MNGEIIAVFLETGTWTCPEGITSVCVEAWGGTDYARLKSFPVVAGNSYNIGIGDANDKYSYFNSVETLYAKGTTSNSVGDVVHMDMITDEHQMIVIIDAS